MTIMLGSKVNITRFKGEINDYKNNAEITISFLSFFFRPTRFYYLLQGDSTPLWLPVLNGIGLDSDAGMSLIKYICMEII